MLWRFLLHNMKRLLSSSFFSAGRSILPEVWLAIRLSPSLPPPASGSKTICQFTKNKKLKILLSFLQPNLPILTLEFKIMRFLECFTVTSVTYYHSSNISLYSSTCPTLFCSLILCLWSHISHISYSLHFMQKLPEQLAWSLHHF